MKHVSEIVKSPKGFRVAVVLGGNDVSFDYWRMREVRRASMFMERLIITDMKGVQCTYKCYGRIIEVAASICRDIQRARECGQWENEELGELCKRLAAV